VAGYNVEYSGLKFGMFYVGEFLHAFTGSMLFATLFLGGYRGPFVEQFPLLGIVYLLIKTFIVYFVTILSRGALPRFRIDQLLNLNWKVFTPLALTLVFATALVDKALVGLGAGLFVRTVVLFAMNIAIYWATTRLMDKSIQPKRKVVSAERPLATANGPKPMNGVQSGQDHLSV
jgi:NADH-quinone oxidoreductase subunit H